MNQKNNYLLPLRPEAPLSEVQMVDAIAYAMETRRSIRGFLPDVVPQAKIKTLLEWAARAPSGNNTQPWQVHVLTGAVLDGLSAKLRDAFNKGRPEEREYDYYPEAWREPYLTRRRETGWGLYELVGIAKGDRQGSKKQHARNFNFFEAPVGLIFSIDDDLATGSWMDYGGFIQSIMIGARALGLDTCAQAAIAGYPTIVHQHVGISANKKIVCGLALGCADPEGLANRLVTSRIEVDSFTSFKNT